MNRPTATLAALLLLLLAPACGSIGRAVVGPPSTDAMPAGMDVVRDGPVQPRPDVTLPDGAVDDCVPVSAWDAGGAASTGDDGGTSPDDDGSTGCTLPDGCDTGGTITGVVHAPNGTDPIVGAFVYALPPGGDSPLPTGPSCIACDPPATSCATARTRVDGTFTLEGLTPGMQTLVVRIGRFRRQFTLNVPCGITAAPPEMTRLPKNHTEGDLPRIAVATGDYDELECVLSRAGIDASEIDVFNNAADPTLAVPSRPTLHQLLSDATMLAGYSVLVANCTANDDGLYSDTAALANLEHFVATGGRLVATDWAYDLIEQVPQWAPAVCWQGTACCTEAPEPRAIAEQGTAEATTATVLDSTMVEWLRQVGATTSESTAPIDALPNGWAIQASIAPPTESLVQATVEGGTRSLLSRFDYDACGRVVYSSFHTLGRDDCPASGCAFPNYCPPIMATAQERILEYVFFDLTTCAQPPAG